MDASFKGTRRTGGREACFADEGEEEGGDLDREEDDVCFVHLMTCVNLMTIASSI